MGSSPELRLPGRASVADHSHMHGLHQQALQHLVAGYGGQAGALGLLGSPGQHRGQASLGSVRSTGSEGHEPAGEGFKIITLTCVARSSVDITAKPSAEGVAPELGDMQAPDSQTEEEGMDERLGLDCLLVQPVGMSCHGSCSLLQCLHAAAAFLCLPALS